MSRRQWMALIGMAGVLALAGPTEASTRNIRQNRASRRGFYANTYLIEGPQSFALIDAHLHPDEAQELSALILAAQKPLEAVVITHPHPDHYLGLEHLGSLFPHTRVLSSDVTLRFIRTAAADWPEFKAPLIAVGQGELTLAGRRFQCSLMPDAESMAPLVLFETETRTLITGDHVLNRQHLWLVEGRPEAWLRNLDHLAALAPKTVLPGHGAIGSAELIGATQAYLRDILELTERNTPTEHLRAEMLRRYPEHVFVEALDDSLRALL